MQNCKKCQSPKIYTFFIISPILFELKRCTIPHFKALDKLFRPLAGVLTVGAITFVLLRKMSVYFFSWHTLHLKLSLCIETCAGSRAANGALGKLSQIIALFHASLISHRTTNQPRSSFTDNQKAWCVNSPGNPVAAPRGGSMRRDVGEADIL